MLECLRVFLSRVLALFRRGHLDEELEDELGFHLDMQVQANLRKGMNPKEARGSALRSLGGLDRVKEEYRDRRSLRFLEDFARDLRYGLRMLRRNPVFALAVIVTLALGIGANTAVFSVVDAALLRPLPFDRPQELVQIKADTALIGITPYFWEPEFLAFQRNARKLSGIAAYNTWEQSNLSGGEGAERVAVGRVSANLFSLLGVPPRMGRNVPIEKESPGGGPAVILSHGLWKRRFAGDPAVLGRSLLLDGASYEVIGILPASFDFPSEQAVDLWTFLPPKDTDKYGQGRDVNLIGRLKPSSPIPVAGAELDSIYQAMRPVMKGHVVLAKWQEEITRQARLPLLLFLGTVGFVLLIACANVASLLMARSAAREKEFVVRASLGARKLRILRQLLTESLWIALGGAGLGLALTLWAKDALRSLVSENLQRISAIRIDLRVLGFTLMITLLTSVIFSVIPALQTSRLSLGQSSKQGGRSFMGTEPHRIQKLFMIFEVGLVVVLLTGAGLLLKSLLLLRRIDPGYRPENLLKVTVDLSLNKYPTVRSQASYFEEALRQLKRVPGIQRAAATASLPMGGRNFFATGMQVEGIPPTVPEDSRILVCFAPASADYFQTMGIPLLHGRVLSDGDGEGSSGVAIVDHAFVRRYSPGQIPIGRRIRNPFQKNIWLTIVGVVGNVHQYGLEKEAEPHVYTSYLQPGPSLARMSIVIQCARDPMKFAALVREVLGSLDRDQPAFDIMTLEESLSRSLYRQRTNSFLIGAFAILALLLAAAGIYGVVSYSVNQRTHEIGVRMALGARKGDVLWMVVREAMSACFLGLLLGLGGALTATRLISSLLYGVSATDASTFAAAFLFATLVAFAASHLPARRAATVDPAKSLRHE